MARLQAEVGRIPEAIIFPFNIPTIAGFGASPASTSSSRTGAAA